MEIGKLNIRRTVSALLAGLLLVSCSQQLQTTYDNQDKKIDSFISSQLSSGKALRVFVNGGSSRLVLKEGEGADSLSVSGKVTFYYAAYTFTGSLSQNNLFDTNHEETASGSGWGGTGIDTSPRTLDLGADRVVEGLRNGLFGVKAGQECYILFNGKYGFGSKPVGTVDANSALLYHIWVESIQN
ncbi:MAG: FKBP-type peptidyl-prolyl cis-trans isomerase [Candidatus Cryptobacteroides sp.]